MIVENSLRDQLTKLNNYDILICWNKRLLNNSNTCLKEIITDKYYYSSHCLHNCDICLQELMNEPVLSQK